MIPHYSIMICSASSRGQNDRNGTAYTVESTTEQTQSVLTTLQQKLDTHDTIDHLKVKWMLITQFWSAWHHLGLKITGSDPHTYRRVLYHGNSPHSPAGTIVPQQMIQIFDVKFKWSWITQLWFVLHHPGVKMTGTAPRTQWRVPQSRHSLHSLPCNKSLIFTIQLITLKWNECTSLNSNLFYIIQGLK